MKAAVFWLCVSAFSLGMLAGIKIQAYVQDPLKDACEFNLPRNQHCVMQYVPEDNQ